MTNPANTCTRLKASLRTMKANNAPNREEVEKIMPVRREPISLRPSIKKSIENPMLNAPAVTKYGTAYKGIIRANPNA